MATLLHASPALVGAVCLFASVTARADDLETARLTYDAGDTGARCPDAESFGRQVAARLGYQPFVPDGKHRVVVRLRAAAMTVHAHAEVTRAGSVTAGVRNLEGDLDKCETLTEALATAVAIALDPLRSAGAAQALPPLPPLPSEPRSSEPSPPAPPAPEPTTSPPAPPTGAAARERLTFFASAGFVASGWLLPGASLGGDVGVGARTRGFSLEASGQVEAMPAAVTLATGDRVEGTVFSALLAPCIHLGAWSACALGRVGSLQGHDPDLAASSLGSTVFGALGGRVGYALPLSPALALRVLASVEAPLVRTILAIDQTPVWIAPPAFAAIEIGLTLAAP